MITQPVEAVKIRAALVDCYVGVQFGEGPIGVCDDVIDATERSHEFSAGAKRQERLRRIGESNDDLFTAFAQLVQTADVGGMQRIEVSDDETERALVTAHSVRSYDFDSCIQTCQHNPVQGLRANTPA